MFTCATGGGATGRGLWVSQFGAVTQNAALCVFLPQSRLAGSQGTRVIICIRYCRVVSKATVLIYTPTSSCECHILSSFIHFSVYVVTG